MKSICVFLLCLMLLAFPALADDGIFVKPIDDLPPDFLFAADISSVIALERSGVKFYDASGKEQDLFALLKESGWNMVRIRIWNDPFDAEGHPYGGGVCDVEVACEIAKRAAEQDLALMVDFHYSDFWADPGKQFAPKAWKNMTLAQKEEALYQFTLDALTRIKATGADVKIVQMGNETDAGMAGETSYTALAALINAGGKAVKEVYPSALRAVHFSKPQFNFPREIIAFGAEFDVYCTSYYPYWHGSLDNLVSVLTQVQKTYGKQVMIAETAYPFTMDDSDFNGNSVPGDGVTMPWPITVQGQADALRAVAAAAKEAGALGIAYWEPAWLSVPGNTWAENAALWETYGSGWASSYAAAYDPNDAGKYYGGSSWDNQALFGFDHKALPTLSMPTYLRTGAKTRLERTGYEEIIVRCPSLDTLVLPDTIQAHYNDGSVQSISVTWDQATLSKLEEDYHISGLTADGDAVNCRIELLVENCLVNPGFEDADVSMYSLENRSGGEVYRSTSINDCKSGNGLFHFYDGDGSVDFTITQTLNGLFPGTYQFSLYIHGGDVNKSDMEIFVLINGEEFAAAPMSVTKWKEWQHPCIQGIPVQAGDEITVGARITCQGKGPWGKLDDWELIME
ncbi:MAG: arabinogalactan endo-1,4-beta-galactosidase [Clostridiales bacterium]|nr:arabinogalactan endo-1,4-beta-galactosidase [Clostridiales bacterium]